MLPCVKVPLWLTDAYFAETEQLLVDEAPRTTMSPSAFMRGLRPEYYSDTEDCTAIILEREVLEHHLTSITSRNETQGFELFCRKLCERTICPNLRPATGPHGGGDSKADTETIPVAEELSRLWYIGEQSAANARWAFAFSAKKKWAEKVRSDVAGLIDRKRGYQQIFCVTNQFARDGTRSALEDELTRQYKTSITILDLSWIVKEVIENDRKDLAFDYLGIGHEVGARRLGPKDYSRATRLEELENEIGNPSAFGGVERQRVAAALVAARLSRSLERPQIETDGRCQRAIRLATECGSHRQILEAHYETLWTAYWWFDDIALVNRSYEAFEQLVLSSDHASNLEFLSNILQLFFNSVMLQHLTADECDLLARAKRAEARFKEVADQPERPNNSIEVRLLLLMLGLNQSMLAKDTQAISALWPQFSALLEEGKGLGEFDAMRVVRLIEVAGSVARNDPNYDRLVEKVAEFAAERISEGESALVLLKRAKQLDFDRHFDMIRLLGRASRQLAKKEYADQLIEATQLLALAYRSAGLLWAARANCVFAMASIIVESEGESNLRVEIVPTVVLWAWTCLELRHVPDLLEAIQLLNGMLNGLPLTDESKAVLTERLADLDFAFASQILNLKETDLRHLEQLPEMLGSLSMFVSQTALLYSLGYEAKLREIGAIPDQEDAAQAKDLFERLASQLPSDSVLGPLIVNCSGRQTYNSKIIGMRMDVVCEGSDCSILVAEAFLAATEAFFATAVELEIVPHTEQVSIEVTEVEAINEPTFAFDQNEMRGQIAWPKDRLPASFSVNGKVQHLLIEAAARIMDAACFIKHTRVARTLVDDEAVFDRVAIISVAGNSYHRMLSRFLSRLSEKVSPASEMFPTRHDRPFIVRKETSVQANMANSEPSIAASIKQVLGDNHRKMTIQSVINVHSWNQAGWQGVLYGSAGPRTPPLLGLLFADEVGARKIFKGWRDRFGSDDTADEIHISIVRGISEKHPHHYVVIIASNPVKPKQPSENHHVIFASRMQRMQPDSSVNIDNFLSAYRSTGRYGLLPAVRRSNGPDFILDLAIGKRELSVKRKSEIGPYDFERVALKMSGD